MDSEVVVQWLWQRNKCAPTCQIEMRTQVHQRRTRRSFTTKFLSVATFLDTAPKYLNPLACRLLSSNSATTHPSHIMGRPTRPVVGPSGEMSRLLKEAKMKRERARVERVQREAARMERQGRRRAQVVGRMKATLRSLKGIFDAL